MTTTIVKVKVNVLSELRSVLKNNKALNSIATDDAVAQKVADKLTDFADLENRTRVSLKDFGEISYKLLQLPLAEQQAITHALAEKMGLPSPNYSKMKSRDTGRIQWAHVVYGKYPELCKRKDRWDADTLAGRRVSEAMRLYRVSAGLIPKHTKRRVKNRIPMAAMHKSFDWLAVKCQSDKELQLLSELYMRVGIAETKLTEWTEEVTTRKAA